MTVSPLPDRLVVRPLEEGEQPSGGIVIPDTANEKPQQGRVIAADFAKANTHRKRLPLDVKKGGLILFRKYTSQDAKIDSENVSIMREDEVLAVIEDGAEKTEE